MINTYLGYLAQHEDSVDTITIVNKEGIVEYSTLLSATGKEFVSEGLVGKNILDIYPSLSEATSSHFRSLKSGQSIINEKQTLNDFNGRTIETINSTFPITSGSDIIGTFETSKIYFNEVHHKKDAKSTLYTVDDIIGQNMQMLRLKERLLQLATTDASVLISGETGTGKELVAQALHYHSVRSSGPFVSVNVSAIPDNLLESTLFGTTKGSFTGSVDRIGLFEKANSGTLFLDELNSMNFAMQSKILRAIETKTIRRVGDVESRSVDVRFISAINVRSEEALVNKQLRDDLFFRLAASQLYLTPLRERRDDIELLIQSFIPEDISQSPMAQKTLSEYHWPGNVRELKNAISYATSVCSSKSITIQDIPEYILFSQLTGNTTPFTEKQQSLAEMTAEFEKEIIEKVLGKSRTLTEASNKLKLTRQALRYKMDKYGILWK